jgi:hypothetical protein
MERDQFVDQVFATVGLPVLHIPVARTYDLADLADKLRQAAPVFAAVTNPSHTPRPTQPTATPLVNIPKSPTPVCPRCNAPMILRTAQQGTHQGRQFYGCSNYPRCTERIAVA